MEWAIWAVIILFVIIIIGIIIWIMIEGNSSNQVYGVLSNTTVVMEKSSVTTNSPNQIHAILPNTNVVLENSV